MITFSNPRLAAKFADWPLGGNKRGECTFTAEFKEKKGWRIAKQTTGKPKHTTYSQKVAIVDGSNGKTYILKQSPPEYGESIHISRSDFLDAPKDELGFECHNSKSSQPEKYQELLDLINQAHQ